jgi:hypothetical protein
MIDALIETILDALGVTGTSSERHRGRITVLFIGLAVALCAAILVAIVMIATGHA